MKTDMTKGNPMKIILMFSIPVLMGNLFQQFYNMVDTIIVGQYLGSDALCGGWINRLSYVSGTGICASIMLLAIILTVIVSAVLTIPTVLASKAVSYMDEHTGEYSEYGGCIYKGYFAGIFCTMSYNVASGLFAKHR